MKYAAIITYNDGSHTGAAIKAAAAAEAWRKVLDLFDPEHIAAVSLSQILTEERGAGNG